MSNITKIVIAGLAVVIVAVLVMTFRPTPTPSGSSQGKSFGALAGPDIPSPYLAWGAGAVPVYQAAATMTQQSSTTCMFQSPAATSTLERAVARFNVASSSMVAEWGSSANIDATTTSYGTGTLSTGGQGTFVASTTASQGAAVDGVFVLAPNTYVALKIGSGSIGIPQGQCSVTFRAIP